MNTHFKIILLLVFVFTIGIISSSAHAQTSPTYSLQLTCVDPTTGLPCEGAIFGSFAICAFGSNTPLYVANGTTSSCNTQPNEVAPIICTDGFCEVTVGDSDIMAPIPTSVALAGANSNLFLRIWLCLGDDPNVCEQTGDLRLSKTMNVGNADLLGGVDITQVFTQDDTIPTTNLSNTGLGSRDWTFGDSPSGSQDVNLIANVPGEPKIRYNTTLNQWQASNDGTIFFPLNASAGTQNLFQTFATPSGTSPVADTTTDTLTLTTSEGVTVTGDATTDTINIGLGVVDINGGAIDGTTIGGTTPAGATFTTLTVAQAASFNSDIDVNLTGTENVTILAGAPTAGTDTVRIAANVSNASVLEVGGSSTGGNQPVLFVNHIQVGGTAFAVDTSTATNNALVIAAAGTPNIVMKGNGLATFKRVETGGHRVGATAQVIGAVAETCVGTPEVLTVDLDVVFHAYTVTNSTAVVVNELDGVGNPIPAGTRYIMFNADTTNTIRLCDVVGNHRTPNGSTFLDAGPNDIVQFIYSGNAWVITDYFDANP